MNEITKIDRFWRIDSQRSPLEQSVEAEDITKALPTDVLTARCRGGHITEADPRVLARTIWGLKLLRRRFGTLFSQKSRRYCWESPAETLVHDFAKVLTKTFDPSRVAAELVHVARNLTGARRVEFDVQGQDEIDNLSQKSHSQANCNDRPSRRSIPLVLRTAGHGDQYWGTLRLEGIPVKRWNRTVNAWSDRSLETICTLAALAFDTISTSQLFESLEGDSFDESQFMDPTAPRDQEEESLISFLRDATYLQVILPYAVNQSRRHREAVSILYMGVDRLAAIRKVLGPSKVDEALNRVGEIIGHRLRTSDVVSRMEDDRILAMLPNAPASDALRIAREIHIMVETSCMHLENLPPLTLSIGVATFPTHANDVHSLLNAADMAMELSLANGRNNVEIAKPLERHATRDDDPRDWN